MDAAQQKVYDELVADGGFDKGSVAFAGEKYRASVWTASQGKAQCLVVALAGERTVTCADPKKGTFAPGVIGVQMEDNAGDGRSSVTVYRMRGVSGEWKVITCAAIVDPDSHEAIHGCTSANADEVQLPFRDAVYSVRWSESHGTTLTVERVASAASHVSCDRATGQCTQVEVGTGG